MSASSSVAASSVSFHFSATQTSTETSSNSDQHSPVSPSDAQTFSSLPGLPAPSPSLLISAPRSHEEFELATPSYPGQQPLLESRPSSTSLSHSFPGGFETTDAFSERHRRTSYGGSDGGEVDATGGDIWGTPVPRVVRAASDGGMLAAGMAGTAGRGEQPEKDAYDQERAALFREHERRSLENSAAARLSTAFGNSPTATLPLSNPTTATTSVFLQQQQTSMLQKQKQQIHSSLAPLHSPASPPLPSPLAELQQSQAQEAQAQSLAITHAQVHAQASEGRFESASLHLGDLDAWMDEAYVRECCARMGWDGVTNVKMIRGASPSSGYCFLTFPSAAHAAQVLARFAASPPTLMPRSARTFKLNWGTGLPGVQPRWEGEYSVFVGDLGREVGETELVSLFTPLFPSTKSAKIMYDPSTGISRGYGFVRFADDSDMQRALLLGQNAGSGLSLHGRTLRISEASGPGNAVDGSSRDRSRTRSSENLSIHTGGGAQYSANGAYGQHHDLSPTSPYPDFLSPTFPVAFAPPISPGAYSNHSNNNPGTGARSGYGAPMGMNGGGGGGGAGAGTSGGPPAPAPHTTDPNNTTVFVGGLPACISEETLKSFFHHFGDITYCKIPTGKGCGFVQFVRRVDAELAIVKMNDFPIHGKSRIRLSWGRSQGDKQVEQVRKLASALGVPFEAVWRMVQGQDNTTIKQIATAVGETPVLGGRFESLGVGRMELGAVASAAGLTEAEVLELVGGRASVAESYSAAGNSSSGRSESDFFPRTTMSGSVASLDTSLSSGGASGAGPYSRVSPSSFSAFTGPRQPQNLLPISPPPSAAGEYSQHQLQYQQQAHLQQNSHPSQQQGYGGASPYNSIRPDSYLVPSPSSPYERVDFAEGGIRGGERYQSQPPHQQASAPSASSYQLQQQQQQSQQPYSRYVGPSGYQDSQYLNHHQGPPHQQQQQQHPSPYQSNGGYEQHQSERAYTTSNLPPRQQGSIETSFANLSFSSPPLPPRTNNSSSNLQQQAFVNPSSSDFFPAVMTNGKVEEPRSRAYLAPAEERIAGAQWGSWPGDATPSRS